MDPHSLERLADRLLEAEMTRLPIDVPSLAHPDMTAEEGYHVQRTIIAKKVARGARG